MESIVSLFIPIGGFSINTSPNGNHNALDNPSQISRNNMTVPPSESFGNNTRFRSGSTPPNLGNMTQNKNVGSTNMPDKASNQLISSSRALIFSGDNLKIYKIME